MADKTFGVKVSEETYEQVQNLISASGLTAKEWFDKAVALVEMQSLKEGASEYSQDLNELEIHTKRIYELVANMIRRAVYVKDHAVKEVTEKLESKELVISDLQKQVHQFQEALKENNNANEKLQEELKKAEETLAANQKTLENQQELINEYKEKNDSLSGIIAKYQGYAEEIEVLRERSKTERTELTARALKAEEEVERLSKELEEVKAVAIKEKQRLEETLQLTIERKDLEREKALVELERKHQETINELHAAHTEEIRSLYAEIAELRKKIEDNREKHQAEIAALKLRKESEENKEDGQ